MGGLEAQRVPQVEHEPVKIDARLLVVDRHRHARANGVRRRPVRAGSGGAGARRCRCATLEMAAKPVLRIMVLARLW